MKEPFKIYQPTTGEIIGFVLTAVGIGLGILLWVQTKNEVSEIVKYFIFLDLLPVSESLFFPPHEANGFIQQEDRQKDGQLADLAKVWAPSPGF